MEKKLTTEQIDQLYTFTRQHYVEWYDLQTELVDHLANAIETEWQQNPKLTFDEVLSKEFQKFGVFGFMDVIEEKRKFLQKKYNQIVLSQVKTFFTLPKIMLTIATTGFLYMLLKVSQYNGELVLLFYSILIVFVFYAIISHWLKRKKQIKENQKRWLLKDIINQYGSFAIIIIFPLNIFMRIFNHSEQFLNSEYAVGFTSFFLVLGTIFLYVIFVLIPKKSEEYLLKYYPEYNF